MARSGHTTSDPRPAIQHGLGKSHEVGRRRDVHDVLQERRYAFEGREAAGQQEHDDENRDRQKRKLRHGVGDRRQQDAEGRDGEEMDSGSGEEELHRADDWHPESDRVTRRGRL